MYRGCTLGSLGSDGLKGLSTREQGYILNRDYRDCILVFLKY